MSVQYKLIDDDFTPRGRYRRVDDPERLYGLFVHLDDIGFVSETDYEDAINAYMEEHACAPSDHQADKWIESRLQMSVEDALVHVGCSMTEEIERKDNPLTGGGENEV